MKSNGNRTGKNGSTMQNVDLLEGLGTTSAPAARRTSSKRSLAAMAVVLLMVISAFVVLGMPAASAASIPPTHASAASLARPTTTSPGHGVSPSIAPSSGPSSPLRFSPHPASTPNTTGRGTFLQTTNLSQVSLAHMSCQHLYYTSVPVCPNTTFNPSINVSSTGVVGVAYTQITNYTHCPSVLNISNNTTLDVAFQFSSTNGVSWSNPVYLGNENCSQAQNLSMAWDPSLTSLANGTFVVTYVEFSLYKCIGPYCTKLNPPDIYPYEVAHDNLVVQESYNGGANWTAPMVLNSTSNPSPGSCGVASWPAYRPSISAYGNSIDLVWENYSNYGTCGASPYSSGVHLVSSSDGGATWSNATPVTFPTVGAAGHPVNGQQTNFSVNPTVLAAPNGQVYVSYATGLSQQTGLCEPSGCYAYSTWAQDIVVANTTNVSGNWTVNYAAKNIPLNYYNGGSGSYYGPFTEIAPQLAYSSVTGQLFVAYDALLLGTFCYHYQTYRSCSSNSYESAAFLQNSSNGGANWSQPSEIGSAINPYGGDEDVEYYPVIAVDHNGTLQATVEYYNETYCVTVTYVFCGAYEQIYFNSTDNGSSWNGPFSVSPFFVTGNDYGYRGEYESAAVAPSGAVYFAWTNSQCTPGSTGPYCFYLNYYYPEPNTTVAVSWLFEGVGFSVTFHETNLTASGIWSAELQGNLRQAPAGTNLVVSGVPSSTLLEWTVNWVNVTYGTAWQPIAAPSNPVPPTALASNTTLTYLYQEFAQVIVSINPPIDYYYVTAGSNEATYSMTPLPTTVWVPVNSSMSFAVAPQAINCATAFCFYYNLTWVSWTGSGAGSVSTNLTSFTTTVGNTAMNETANFLFLGYCETYGALGTVMCYNANDYPLTFHETGLPNGTSWAVTSVVNSSANGTVTSTTNTPWLNVSTGQTAVQFTAWTIPSGTAGKFWVPTTTPSSPVKEPTQTLVNVTYALVDVNTTQFTANFTALGLPNSTTWSADIGSASYAVTDGNLSVPVSGGQGLALNGSPVYTENGVGYYASSVSVDPYVMNETWANTTVLPDTYIFNGSAHVYVQYSPEFWLTVASSGGGNVTPASLWVPTGGAVALTATPSTGYHFLDWASVGAGGTTLAQSQSASVTIHPTAPVNEFATFRKIPPPTWNVSVTANGLPVGTGFTFTLGTVTYTSAGPTMLVGELLNNSYAFAAETAYASTSMGTRWVPTSSYSTYGPTGGGILTIQSDGMIFVNYTTQYVLAIASTPNGAVTPAVGSTWTNAGTVVALTATPAYHYKFAGWNGSGIGSVTSGSPTISVTLTGPVWEAAAFVYRIFPLPALYHLMVVESGLPTGTSWNVSAGTGNASAAGGAANLTIAGLNGTYTLTVPAVYVSTGVRYVAPAVPVTVAANGSTTVTFTEQFALTVTSSAGGSVSGAGTSWVGSGSQTPLTATPATGYQFSGWDGTGTGAATPYTGASASSSVTVAGPTNETATFVPIVQKVTTGSSTAGQVPALGLLAVLLVVGLVVGLIAGRRRTGGSASSEEPSAEGGTDAEGAPMEESTYGSAPQAPAAEYDESTP
ncbi:MAG: hypothetical protein L3K01_02510 [Thermoplasmata archaeon]|nr:hypothetical protein [Thermoplasmata archaeon]